MSNLMPYRFLSKPETSFFNDDFFRPFFRENNANAFRVDVRDMGENYLMEAEIPGIEKDKLSISVNDGVMTIAADYNSEEKTEKQGYIMTERKSGRMSRSFSIEGVDDENIRAEYTNGVLKLTLPKVTEQSKTPKRIEIQ